MTTALKAQAKIFAQWLAAHLQSKRVQMGITLILCLLIISAGSIAWFSATQRALNEFSFTPEGVNLHDDFSDPNKDVYVENTSQDPILVRVKLTEFMEIGASAKIPLGATRADKNSWPAHGYGTDCLDCGNGFHEYWAWEMGGQKWYVPATPGQAASSGDAAVIKPARAAFSTYQTQVIKGHYWHEADGVWYFYDGRWEYDGIEWTLDGNGKLMQYIDCDWLFDGAKWSYFGAGTCIDAPTDPEKSDDETGEQSDTTEPEETSKPEPTEPTDPVDPAE